MKYDNIIITDGNNEITIYPLAEINKNNKKFIIYTKSNNMRLDNLLVGEITKDNELIPIDNNQVSEFENIILETYNNILKIKEA